MSWRSFTGKEQSTELRKYESQASDNGLSKSKEK